MDVKNVLNQILPINTRAKDRVQKAIKSDSATDRDANGQQTFGEKKDEHPPMNEEQLQKAIAHLKSLPAVTENNLTIEAIQHENRYFVLLKEPSGKVIRRIPESELWTLQILQEDKRGQILNKSA